MTERESRKVIARNRKARHEFELLDHYEAGVVLRGPEVKSIRAGKVGFQDAFARVEDGEVWLYNFHISPYDPARVNEEPDRKRKLLLKKREIEKLIGGVEEKGLTLIPTELYFRGGYAKFSIAVARGRKLYDKREKLKQKTQEREARRAVRQD